MTIRSEFRLTKILVALCLLAWLAVAALLAGPRLEAALAPVRVDQRVEAVTRTKDRLCWDWVSRKVREGATDDLDVFLYAEGIEGRMVVSVYGAKDGMPWRRARVSVLGPLRWRWCVELPAHVPETAPVWLEMTAWYPGLGGLWRVPLPMPVVGAPRLKPEHPPPG